MKPFITIFTPTYNRAYILGDLYQSLCEQTDRNFVWLIVDDGSTDSTRELVEEWKKEGKISISYVYQENAGKSTAHNKAAELCDTELFMCVDSDDVLVRGGGVKTIHGHWDIDRDKTAGLAGYVFPQGRKDGTPGGELRTFPASDTLAPFIELTRTYHYQGETSIAWVASHLKRYRFPVIPGEKSVTEIVLYFQISGAVPVKFERDIVYLFEYQADGLTRNGPKTRALYPKAFTLVYAYFLMASWSLKMKLVWQAEMEAWMRSQGIDREEIRKILVSCHYPLKEYWPEGQLYRAWLRFLWRIVQVKRGLWKRLKRNS